MAILSLTQMTRVLAVIAGVTLAGCSSPYEDIRVTAAQSPGIGIEDVEVMAFNEFVVQLNRGNSFSPTFPARLFLDPTLGETEIRRVYAADRQGCGQSRPDASFGCLRRVLVGNTLYDIYVQYSQQLIGTQIVRFSARPAPVL